MEKQNAYNWINDYQGKSSFLLSLQHQYQYKGFLSDRQLECLIKAMSEQDKPRQFSINAGEKIVLSKGISERITNSMGVGFKHRGFLVTKVHNETAKAYLVDLKLTTTRTVNCCVCGITLSNDVSRSIGIGPVCAKNHGIPYEMNAMQSLALKLEAVDTIEKVWVAKWSIREREQQAVEFNEAV